MSVRPLIGLTGFKGSGKDTVANILVEEFGYHRKAFATALKEEINAAQHQSCQWSDAPKFTSPYWSDEFVGYMEDHRRDAPDSPSGWPRMLAQAWGQMRRDTRGQDYWVNLVTLKEGIVVSDVRYANEADAIKRAGGCIVAVCRSSCMSDGPASESVLDNWIDLGIGNDGTLDELANTVRGMMASIARYGIEP